MSKIQLHDNMQDALFKMSEGNPGGLATMIDILKNTESIDPQSAMGGFGVLLSLDTMEIYGSQIYILYNDQCHRDIRSLLMLLRANQLGYINTERIKKIAESETREFVLSSEEMNELDKKVCERLSTFQNKEED